MQYFLLFLAALLPALTASAQTYFSQRCTPSPVYTGATDVVLEPGGGYVVAGQAADSLAQPGYDMCLFWLNDAGQVTHSRFYNQPGADLYTGGLGGSLLRTHDGRLAVTGSATTINPQLAAGKLWRFTARGDTLWTHFYRAPTNLIIYNGIELADGGFALVGTLALTPTSVSSTTDLLLIRTDSLGQELWRHTYNAAYYDVGHHVVATPDGGLLISGYTTTDLTAIPYNSDLLLIKTDAAGNQQWQRVLGGPYADASGPAVLLPRGGYLVSGSWSDQLINFEYGLAKPTLLWLDSAGQLLRRRSYGPGRYGTGTYAFSLLSDGGYILAGQTTDPTNAVPQGNGFAEAYVLRVCADGDSVWYRTYKLLAGGRSQNYLRDLKPTPDGGFVAAGFAHPRPPDTGTPDAWVFKVDSAGYLQAGGAPPGVTCRPITTSVGGELIMKNQELRVWPNPSADGRFRLSSLAPRPPLLKERGRLVVTDALGRVVWRREWDGAAETVVDLRGCAPGLYVLRLTGADGRSAARKLVRE